MKNVYLGEKPYIFISYAHADIELVSPIIQELQKKYRVWYDTGIKPGHEWEVEIIDRLMKSALFLFFVSDNSLRSQNCKDEIYSAREHNKPFINVVLDKNVNFTKEFKFRFDRYQMIYYDKYKSVDKFVLGLESLNPDWFKMVEDIKEVPVVIEEAVPAKPKKKRIIVISSIAAALVCVAVACIIIFTKQNNMNNSSNETVEIETTPLEYFTFSEDKTVLLQLNQSISEVVVPKFVKEIGEEAFMDSSIEKVVFQNGLETINARAFMNCSKLNEVVFPETLTLIGDAAFYDCTSLIQIELPPFLTSIGSHSFQKSGLVEIDFPKSLTSIGESAFCETQLTKLYIGPTIKGMGLSVFALCPLTDITFDSQLDYDAYSLFSGCQLIDTMTVSNDFFNKNYSTFNCYYKFTNYVGGKPGEHQFWVKDYEFYTEVISPAHVNSFYFDGSIDDFHKNGDRSAEDSIFNFVDDIYVLDSGGDIENKGKKYSKISDSITISLSDNYIAKYAFSGCKAIKHLVIESGPIGISEGAFTNCENLETVFIPKTITSIGNSILKDCDSLKGIYYESNKTDFEMINFEMSPSWKDLVYYYSETQPESSGNYWHYVNGVITKWE